MTSTYWKSHTMANCLKVKRFMEKSFGGTVVSLFNPFPALESVSITEVHVKALSKRNSGTHFSSLLWPCGCMTSLAAVGCHVSYLEICNGILYTFSDFFLILCSNSIFIQCRGTWRLPFISADKIFWGSVYISFQKSDLWVYFG